MKLYQINTKGNKVLKLIGTGTETEAALKMLQIVKRAVSMEKKQGHKYLRTLGVSKAQPIHFESFNVSKLQKLGTIRLGQFVDNYSAETLEAIINDIKSA
jgi:hypothetical protein